MSIAENIFLSFLPSFFLQVFSKFTSNVRRALFKVLQLQHFDEDNSVVIGNGEKVKVADKTTASFHTIMLCSQVNRWYVVLNGVVKHLSQSSSVTGLVYHVGDS